MSGKLSGDLSGQVAGLSGNGGDREVGRRQRSHVRPTEAVIGNGK
jgi:hypothetical protein